MQMFPFKSEAIADKTPSANWFFQSRIIITLKIVLVIMAWCGLIADVRNTNLKSPVQQKQKLFARIGLLILKDKSSNVLYEFI